MRKPAPGVYYLQAGEEKVKFVKEWQDDGEQTTVNRKRFSIYIETDEKRSQVLKLDFSFLKGIF